jgi:hypothetical protein
VSRDELVTVELRREDVEYLLEHPRPFYRNTKQVVRILDAVRRALANGNAAGRH